MLIPVLGDIFPEGLSMKLLTEVGSCEMGCHFASSLAAESACSLPNMPWGDGSPY